MLAALDSSAEDGDWYDACVTIHRELQRDASVTAADTVLQLIEGSV